jgi:hypothetical protein
MEPSCVAHSRSTRVTPSCCARSGRCNGPIDWPAIVWTRPGPPSASYPQERSPTDAIILALFVHKAVLTAGASVPQQSAGPVGGGGCG